MDRLTHIDVANSVKVLGVLGFLILSKQFSFTQIADWTVGISWNRENVFQRRCYNSDEFQCLLKKLTQEIKKEKNKYLHTSPEEGDVG